MSLLYICLSILLLTFIVDDSSKVYSLVDAYSIDGVSRQAQRGVRPPEKRFAICLNGQLARLELASKIKNIFYPNLEAGHELGIFVLLDNDIENVKQSSVTKLGPSPYSDQNITSHRLRAIINSTLIEILQESGIYDESRPSSENPKFSIEVKLEKQKQTNFPLAGPHPPTTKNDKVSGLERYQMNTRMFMMIRQCVKWIQKTEVKDRKFYDFIIRLREDTLALSPWYFDVNMFRNNLVSLDVGSWKGLNDHHLVVDRAHVDPIFRGSTEDYYLENFNTGLFWGNSESLLLKLAESYKVPTRTANLCEMPLISLRGMINNTHWLIHPIYRDLYIKKAITEAEKLLKPCARDIAEALVEVTTKVEYPDTKRTPLSRETIVRNAVSFWRSAISEL